MFSQNGWSAGSNTAIPLVAINVPGTATHIPVLAGDVATVLLWVATRFHREVEPLVEPGNWGYAYRPIRGQTDGLSNHASGTAIDLNAPKHPLGTEPQRTLTKAQIASCKRIEADSGGVVRWGGSYTGRKDVMHWEINAGPAAVAALARRITANPTSEEDDMFSDSDRALLKEVRDRIRGDEPDNDILQRIRTNTGDVWTRVRGTNPDMDSLQVIQWQLGQLAAQKPGGLTAADVAALVPESIAAEVVTLLGQRLNTPPAS